MPDLKKELEKKVFNISFAAHVDAGKTTLTETVLFISGEKWNIGKVHDGNTTTGFLAQEKKRGITIISAAVRILWNNSQINVIDTPGHIDFTAEVSKSLRVVDGVVIVLAAKNGVQSQTKTVNSQAERNNTRKIFFINKLDGLEEGIESLNNSVNSIKTKLGLEPVFLQFPIGLGKDLNGIVDIISKKAYYYEKIENNKRNSIIEKEIPEEIKEAVEKKRNQIIEKLINEDIELAEEYLKNFQVEEKTLKKAIKKLTLENKIFPVFCGSAYKNIGIELLLNGIVDYLPSSKEVEDIEVTSLSRKEEKKLYNYKSKTECLALVFNILFDENKNKLVFVRVYSGKIISNSNIYIVNKKKKERIGRLVKVQANKKEEINCILAGDLAAILNLDNVSIGDTIISDSEKNSWGDYTLKKIEIPEPVISQALEAKNKSQKDLLKIALEKLTLQDASLKTGIDRETGQIIISGMGKLHLEIVINGLDTEFNISVDSSLPKISYRETITKACDVTYVYKKQTGGRGHFASVRLKIEPNEGRGFEFIDAKVGDEMTNKQAEEVREGIEEGMLCGLLLNYPIIDLKVTLLGGVSHKVDTGVNDFKLAALFAFRGENNKERKAKIEEYGVKILEPIMNLEIKIPEENKGSVLKDINSREISFPRYSIREKELENEYIINCQVPLRNVLDYSETLKTITKGMGECFLEFSNYKIISQENFKKIFEKNEEKNNKK